MINLENFKIIFSLIAVFAMVSCSSNSKQDNAAFDAELSQYEYPFQVNEFNFKTQEQNLTMRYGDLGKKSAKKVVVLLHGKNFGGYYWEKIGKELASRGYRVIIPDQIGFGKSSKPTYYQYTFSQLALNTKKLLDHLKIENVIVVGHSMGGMLAVHFTTQEKQTQKVVLINPIGLEDYLDYVDVKDPSFFYKNEKNKTVEQFRNYQKKYYYDGKWNADYEELLTPFKGWRKSDDWELVAWNNALTYSPIFSNPISEKFKNLDIDITLIIGTRDRTGPGRNWKKKGVNRELGRYDKLGKQIKSLNPETIKLIELEGLGHMPQFEDYERFSKHFYDLFPEIKVTKVN